MGETVPVVHAIDKNGSKDPVRVNQSDFDLDQMKDAKDRQYKPYTGKDEPAQSIPAGSQPEGALNAPPLAAPSAPHFADGQDTTPARTDPLTGAVAPAVAPADGLYVMKKGSGAKEKFFVVDGTGKVVDDRPPLDAAGYKTEDDARKAIADMPQ